MTHGKLGLGAILVAALAGFACSSKQGNVGTPGAAGAGGSGTAGGNAGAGGSAGMSAGAGGVGGDVLGNDPGCGSIKLAVANDTVYWTEMTNGTVNSVPTAGGAKTVIAMGQASPGPIAADATGVFWANGDDTIMKKPLPTGAAASFIPAGGMDGSTDEVNALLVNNGTLYIGRGLSTSKVATSGGTPMTLSISAERGYPAALAVDDAHLYQTESMHNAITRETLDGLADGAITDGTLVKFAPDRIAVSQGALLTDTIALSGGKVIWANNFTITVAGVNELNATDSFGIATTAGFNSISGFVVSGDTLYVGESDAGNTSIQKIPLVFVAPDAGATPPPATVIAMTATQKNPSSFAADATNIYWRTDDCKIMKLAK